MAIPDVSGLSDVVAKKRFETSRAGRLNYCNPSR